MGDSIEFYSDKELHAWLDEFYKDENMEKIFLSGIPFSYPDIAREWHRRETIKALLKNSKQGTA